MVDGDAPGAARPINEDAVHPTDAGMGDSVLLMVADGLGGHIGGEVASTLAIEVASDPALTPAEAVLSANRAILTEVANRPRLAGMATTMTLAHLDADGSAHFAHVGDSRGYLLRHGELRRINPGSLGRAEYVASGKLTEKEVENHPQRSLGTRALGLEFHLEVDEFEEPLVQGDRLPSLLRWPHRHDRRRQHPPARLRNAGGSCLGLIEAANTPAVTTTSPSPSRRPRSDPVLAAVCRPSSAV